MELLITTLLLIAAVLVSAVLDQIMTRLSLPLVQMIMGVVIMLVAPTALDTHLDAELFLVLFIAPLLFDESRHIDRRALMRNLGGILSLAIGLVIAITLGVGFALHLVEPSIPLAAAFALGATLGPTDAAAVASLSGSVSLDERQRATLSGEALFNDASGVVSFQFAVAAATTGAFSLSQATGTFAISFAGGLALGAVAGLLAALIGDGVRAIGLDGTHFHVVYELVIPFAVFLGAEALHVSGILAVVAAGLVFTLLPHHRSTARAKLELVSSSIWQTLSFILNGVVFLILGMQLPAALLPSWNGSVATGQLLLLTAVATIVTLGIRWVWLMAMDLLHNRHAARHDWRCMARDATIMTLGGPKGAVTLSIALTIPATLSNGSAFPHRDDLLFIASGVIVITLLLANFVMPLLAPQTEHQDDRALLEARRAIAEHVVEGLTGRLSREDTREGAFATAFVLRGYQAQVCELDDELDPVTSYAVRVLIDEIGTLQEQYLDDIAAQGGYDEATVDLCRQALHRAAQMMHGPRRKVNAVRGVLSAIGHRFAARGMHHSPDRHLGSQADQRQFIALVTAIQQRTDTYLRDIAESPEPLTDDQHVRAKAARRLTQRSTPLAHANRTLGPAPDGHTADGTAIRPGKPAPRMTAGCRELIQDAQAQAHTLELEAIAALRDNGSLTHDQASRLRHDVVIMQMADSAGEVD